MKHAARYAAVLAFLSRDPLRAQSANSVAHAVADAARELGSERTLRADIEELAEAGLLDRSGDGVRLGRALLRPAFALRRAWAARETAQKRDYLDLTGEEPNAAY